MSLYRDKGVVLRTYRLGEADRIIVFMTEMHGKVRAVAKGVRKTTSKFGARLEPLTHTDVLFWQGRGDLDIVNQVEVVSTFKAIREDLSRIPAGMSLLEVTDQMAQEKHPDPALYTMLIGALRALADASPTKTPRPTPTPPSSPPPSSSRPSSSKVPPPSSIHVPPAAKLHPPSNWSPSTSSKAAPCAARTAAAAP